ncbi:alpha-glucuronidase family glycosyl hydrolase [Pseudobacter ginsenosidimutans]|uniref:Xylan alpha-1,2-glucuronidase n=1 Tax=Pseudobacter ginsenosidimutans TaxID=661488 RepID=A0A4Q7MZL0_9BACT|nr:alpha-glucuronidase family glycosyl hydrolase [Pseudobacter ginsenosidimutans]QEC40610.1 alpha-glucuronidase [Pseudobacter ginsenosidimutans]RZS72673.1 alpha-glucuronidase [Pseudobacter ginsenosidimutans]
MKRIAFILAIFITGFCKAETGYELWLRYQPIANAQYVNACKQLIRSLEIKGTSPTLRAARSELERGLNGMLRINLPLSHSGSILLGKPENIPAITPAIKEQLSKAGTEGFLIKTITIGGKNRILIAGNTDQALLYGVFHFLRLIQTEQPVRQLDILSVPRSPLRLLNHWDNPDRTIERGYAGFSLWQWNNLPAYIDQRVIDYARANASIGINGTVLTNVNANALILTPEFLQKVKALADVFRVYGIKTFLTARFSAPIEIGGLKTADPLDPAVREWWKKKADSIYQLIPDFGGFLVKANSEGQPGPQDYERTHADGANMLAEALAPHKGIVMWRAFVYSHTSDDRFKQAYEEFKPLDGKFSSNVLVQVKNGPIDFQPREPFSPLFGAMPATPLMMEFQLTQEYLGQSTHLVYQATLYKETLDADTYTNGKGSPVSSTLSGFAGVANIGNDLNWCGHPFAQSNWYALGRLSWDYTLSSETIATEWIKQTFTPQPAFVQPVLKMMMRSRELLVNYMTPLGLTHMMYNDHHYGPMPWGNTLNRPDWNPVYYHKADKAGIGFNRTGSGSNALRQYAAPVQQQFENIDNCPDDYLLWFHHASWDHKMQSGRTLWDELCYRYHTATDSVRAMQQQWKSLQRFVDAERFSHVQQMLAIQASEAAWWRDACLLYFQTFSGKPFPAGYEQPKHDLEYYKDLRIHLTY